MGIYWDYLRNWKVSNLHLLGYDKIDSLIYNHSLIPAFDMYVFNFGSHQKPADKK
jgi:hypothetical protein